MFDFGILGRNDFHIIEGMKLNFYIYYLKFRFFCIYYLKFRFFLYLLSFDGGYFTRKT